MNVNFGQNLAQMALNNFMSMGNPLSQGMGVMNSPIFSQFQQMSQNSFGLGGGFAFAAGGQFNMNPGFLNRPMGQPAGFAQIAGGLGGMQRPWNMMGNMLNGGMPGMMRRPNMQQAMGQLMGQIQQIAGMLNQMAPQMQMMNQLNQAKQASSMGSPMAQMPGTIAPGQTPSLPGMPGAQPSFPSQPASSFLNSLPNSSGGVAKALNVGGRRDVQRINQAVKMLKTAKPKINPGQGKPGKANLALSAADVQAIRSAPNADAAKKLVMQAIAKQTGVKISDINMKDKKAIRNPAARNALNKLLGTKVRNGTEKNSGSSLALDSIAESVAKSIRGGSFGNRQVQSPGGMAWAAFGGAAGMGGMAQTANNMQMGEMGSVGQNFQWGGMSGMAAMGGFGVWHVPGQVQTIPNPASAVNVDLSAFEGAASKVGELASPLIFDLEGTGLQISSPSMIETDIDGDGTIEVITDLDAELGLLVFDSKSEEETEFLTGADMFGDNTDLTAYGIKADSEDGSYADGFQALRALSEHYKLVDSSKQYLDENDLNFLEEEVGLRMRVGGMVSGDDRRFSDISVTQINLGNPQQTQHIEDAPEDRWGNKIMFQDGATFTVFSEVRKYADIWFKIQARYPAETTEDLSISKTDILSKSMR